MTLHVRGREAARYSVTSALSTRLLRALAPIIIEMAPQAGAGTLACEGAALSAGTAPLP